MRDVERRAPSKCGERHTLNREWARHCHTLAVTTVQCGRSHSPLSGPAVHVERRDVRAQNGSGTHFNAGWRAALWIYVTSYRTLEDRLTTQKVGNEAGADAAARSWFVVFVAHLEETPTALRAAALPTGFPATAAGPRAPS